MKEQEFIDVIKAKSPNACQIWMDQKGWYLPSECKYPLQVWISREGDKAWVSAQGHGSCQPLIALTSDELAECIDIWWRNR